MVANTFGKGNPARQSSIKTASVPVIGVRRDALAGNSNAMMSSETIASIAWLNARLTLDTLTLARSLLVDDLVAAVFLGAVGNANTSYLDTRPDVSQKHTAVGSVTAEMRRPAKVSSLARSLNIPRETARGKARDLIALGLVEALPEGLIVNGDALASPLGQRALHGLLGPAEDFLNGLCRLGVFDLDERWKLGQPAERVGWGALRLITASLLRSVAQVTTLSPELGPLSTYVLLAVSHETGAQLELDGVARSHPGLVSPRFGPVRGSAIAARLRMPQETVRRHLHRLLETDRLRLGPEGYSIVITEARMPLWRDYQTQSVANIGQLVWKLKAAGIIVSG